jgi:hypothetical protein
LNTASATSNSAVFNAMGWLFGAIVFAAGVVNVFWGNDPEFGVFIVLLSFVFFPATNVVLDDFTGFKIPGLAKVALAILIVWMTLGVGELPDKIDLMLEDF